MRLYKASQAVVTFPGKINSFLYLRGMFKTWYLQNCNMISAASFSGTGAIDDVVFTSVKPEFINEASMVTITWDTTAVASISIAGTEVEGADFALGTKTVPLVGTTIEVIATAAQNYDLVYTPPENGAWNSSTHQFTGLAANDVCAITGFVPLFDVGGVHFGTLEAAIDAAKSGTALAPATFKLLANCNEMIKFTQGTVILDLAGHDIRGTDEQAFSALSLPLITSTLFIGSKSLSTTCTQGGKELTSTTWRQHYQRICRRILKTLQQYYLHTYFFRYMHY